MTIEEFHKLNLNSKYKFKLYYGLNYTGYLAKDSIDSNFYIVTDSTLNKDLPIKDKGGKKVQLEQISSWELVNDSYNEIKDAESTQVPSKSLPSKIVILGAGASFDHSFNSNLKKEDRPPLTNDIFNDQFVDILKKYPDAYNLSSAILKSTDLESFFEDQWKIIEETHDEPLLIKLISAQYYIHELFYNQSEQYKNCRTSNYLNLIKILHEYANRYNEIVPIVSFNYDTLIEEALQRNDSKYNFNKIDDYVNFDSRKLLLFKPHGSSNWARYFKYEFADHKILTKDFTSPDIVAKYIKMRNYNLSHINEYLKNEIEIIKRKNNQNSAELSLSNNYFPWILIPYKNKDEFVMPWKHTAILQNLLHKIESVLIIGWKGSEQNFQNLIKQNIFSKSIKITLVEPKINAAKMFMEEYSKLLPEAKIIHKQFDTETGMTFTQFMDLCSKSPSDLFK